MIIEDAGFDQTLQPETAKFMQQGESARKGDRFIPASGIDDKKALLPEGWQQGSAAFA
ncbi:hypothetical protein [Rosistilla carotiformis]|uniref:hypothetical protein n=1 Tax=Rosistilla carotiformis TaxID=2528017 RepID=UPI0018D221CB|nr:hypothetical protein [Rosistilla carotiformis]